MKIRKIIFLILIIINCVTIFYFSNQIADVSDNSSGRIVNFIANIFMQDVDEEQRQIICSEILQPIVRKTAHFSIYALLGFNAMNFALCFKGSNYQKGLSSLLFGLFYAITDEVHQLFIEGRSCEFRDVMIDTSGALVGIFIAIFIIYLLRKIFRIKKENKKTINKDAKILFISSTGGHFSELLQLKPIMKKCNYHVVTEKTPSNKNLKARYRHRLSYLLYDTKKHPFKYFFVLLANSFISLFIYLRFRPQIIITTGTHTAGPMCCIGKLLGSKIIYIETFANRKTKTVTGKLLYLIADTFVVQWKEMLKIYPKAKFFGWIY